MDYNLDQKNDFLPQHCSGLYVSVTYKLLWP